MINTVHPEVESCHSDSVRALGLPMLVPQSLYAENGEAIKLGDGRINVRTSKDEKYEMVNIVYQPNIADKENVVTMQIMRNHQTREIVDATYEWQIRSTNGLDPDPEEQLKVEWQLGYSRVYMKGKTPKGFYSIRHDLLREDVLKRDPLLIYETFGKILAVIAADANKMNDIDLLLAQMNTYTALNRLGIVTSLTHLGIAQLNFFEVPAVIPTSLDNRQVQATLIRKRDKNRQTFTVGNTEPGTFLEIESNSEKPHRIFVGGIEPNEEQFNGGTTSRTVIHLTNTEEVNNPGPDEWLFCQMSVKY